MQACVHNGILISWKVCSPASFVLINMTRRGAHSLLLFFPAWFLTINAAEDAISNVLSCLSALVTGDSYGCSGTTPCSNGACCGKSSFCGFGDKYCGTTGKPPNDDCWSNYDAHAKYGNAMPAGNTCCPLNVCCSQ